jgi:hypothetical protein
MLSLRVSAWALLAVNFALNDLLNLWRTLDKKFSPVSRSTCFTGTRKAFPSLALDAARVGHHHGDRPGVVRNSLYPQSLSIQHHDNFPIHCRATAIFSFLPMLPFLPTGPAMM